MAAAPNKEKAFDYAQDVTKQLLTLSTVVITITVSFAKGLAEDAPTDARTVLFVSWGLFAVRIMSTGQISLFVLAFVCIIYFGARAF